MRRWVRLACVLPPASAAAAAGGPAAASPRLTAVNGGREGYVDDAELTSPLAAELRAHHDRAVGFFLALLEQRFGAIHYTLQRQHARNQVPLALASPPTQRSPRSPKGWDASTRVAAAPAPAHGPDRPRVDALRGAVVPAHLQHLAAEVAELGAHGRAGRLSG